ncbi:hypothetical protein [Singulisphaera sp. PoT]|uniref:hypothetical protein n=1 Tax=Singulisphaera sp. PoT TaxID=3411797 RepID=UPI003BF5A083
MHYLESVADALVDRTADELIGALMIATMVAIVMGGIFALGKRKSIQSPSFVIGLALFAGLACMALTAGYFEHLKASHGPLGGRNIPHVLRGWPQGGPGQKPPQGGWDPPAIGWSPGFHAVVAADLNRDGRLTVEEATELVEKADADGDGSVDFHDIDKMLMGRFAPPMAPPRPPVPPGPGKAATP